MNERHVWKSGLTGNIRGFIRRMLCRHPRTFEFFPENCYWSRNGAGQGSFHHGAQMICCMDCGQTWGVNYAE